MDWIDRKWLQRTFKRGEIADIGRLNQMAGTLGIPEAERERRLSKLLTKGVLEEIKRGKFVMRWR